MPFLTLGTVALGVIWAVREIGALSLKQYTSRIGRVGYISERCEIIERTVGENEDVREALYIARADRPARGSLWLSSAGHLYNESDTAIMFHRPQIAFWGVDGPRVSHSNPSLTAEGQAATVLSVPRNGTCAIKLTAFTSEEIIRRHYSAAIPILTLETTSGRIYEFPLASSSLLLDRPVVGWDAKKRRVVVAGTKEWGWALMRQSLGSGVGRIRRSRP